MLNNNDIGGVILETPGANLPHDDVKSVEVVLLNEGVQKDVISEGVEVQADEAHSGVRLERILGLPGDRVPEDEDVVETDVVEEDAAAGVVEEV